MNFGRTPLALSSASAALVERNADDVDAAPGIAVERAFVAIALADDGVAGRQQRGIDQIERLQRARHYHNVVGGAVDAGVALELLDQELAQRLVALRARQ